MTEGEVATITLSGMTTAGQDGTISGSITVEGSTATMRGTWIEPSLSSTVYGQATVPSNTVSGDYSLAVSVNPPGAGSVSLSPSGGSYSSGTSVTLDVSESGTNKFTSWSGDLSGNSDPATITMDASKSVTANFN